MIQIIPNLWILIFILNYFFFILFNINMMNNMIKLKIKIIMKKNLNKYI